MNFHGAAQTKRDGKTTVHCTPHLRLAFNPYEILPRLQLTTCRRAPKLPVTDSSQQLARLLDLVPPADSWTFHFLLYRHHHSIHGCAIVLNSRWWCNYLVITTTIATGERERAQAKAHQEVCRKFHLWKPLSDSHRKNDGLCGHR